MRITQSLKGDINVSNECEGQIDMSEFFKSQIMYRKAMDLTSWINSQGASQYEQIGCIVQRVCSEEMDPKELVRRLTNDISVYVLDMSIGYMNYLRTI